MQFLRKINVFRKEAPPRDEMVYNIKEKPFKAALRKGKYKLLWGSLSQKVLFVFLYSFTSLKKKVKIVYKGKVKCQNVQGQFDIYTFK